MKNKTASTFCGSSPVISGRIWNWTALRKKRL